MSFCQEDGKDKYVFLTTEDANEPSKLPIPEEIDRPENFVKGFLREDGKLNWECACRGSMVASKCGVEARTFLQCLHANMDKSFVDENGSLNWECACRGSMVASRCGVEMRDFFQCIHDNMDNEEKADACLEKFHEVKLCMDKYPEHYKGPEEEESEAVDKGTADKSQKTS